MRKCSICNEKHYAKGLCRSHYHKNHHRINSKRISEYRKKYNKANKEKVNRQKRKYYINNKKSFKKYQKEHPEVWLKASIKQLSKLGKYFNLNSNQYMYALQSWSNTIKKLDNRMCKNCDSKDNLNAHHIMPKSEYPELSLDLDNGITLCENCHGKKHGFEIY